jgi:uncharacterized protein YbjT (DUF2867 family)
MNRTAIVIGATGVVGREVVKVLSALDEVNEIITFTRREYDFESPKVINYVIDFENLEEYADLFQGEYLFSCMGTTKALAGSIEKQRVVDVDYQYEAAKLAQKNGTHHYHLVSSPGADEKSSNAYLQMKGELEEKIKKLDFASRSFYRPSLIVGERPDFRLGEKFGIAAASILPIIPGLKKYRAIKGEQIAKKMVFEAMKNKRGTKVYELDELFNLKVENEKS